MSRCVIAGLPVCVRTTLLLTCPAWAQSVIYINAATGVDTSDGQSSDTAKKTVAAGLGVRAKQTPGLG